MLAESRIERSSVLEELNRDETAFHYGCVL